jgi:predicted GNAT family acetyltransferase
MKRLEAEVIRVRCACGWETAGPEDEVVASVQEHGRHVHNMAATRDQVLAMAMDDRKPDTDEREELRIVDDPKARRYEARLGDRIVAISEYRRASDRVIFLHTEVDPELEGRGIGSRLAAGALDDVRARGLRVTAHCPFIRGYVERHPEHGDLVAS